MPSHHHAEGLSSAANRSFDVEATVHLMLAVGSYESYGIFPAVMPSPFLLIQ